jgi:two-component system sensor histidine kinase ResE
VAIWKSVVGKLWMTIIVLVAVVLLILGFFLLEYIDIHFKNSGDVKRLFIYTSVVGFLLTTFFAFFLSTVITQPLLALKKAADLITKGEYQTRVKARNSDEIGDLGRSFNHMAAEMEKTIKDLNHEKEHLGSVLKSMADAVITFDARGRVMLSNPQGNRILDEWSSLDWESDEQARGLKADQIPEPLQSLFDTVAGEAKQINTKIQVRQGVWSVVMTPLYSYRDVRGAVAVLRDVTEEYRLDKLRKDFVANVSHELRTPIAMLQGYSEALLDDIAGSPEERQELVQVIHDESLRMGRLVKDLLDLARMEAGHLEMQFSEVDIKQLIQRVHRKFSVMAKEKSISLLSDVPSEQLVVPKADEDRLEQVLTNLLDNALRHTSSGKTIQMKASLTNGIGRWISVEVSDQGDGIPAEDVPYIFERFYKADKARTRGTKGGTGLGLAIVKNIIDAHKGSIQVHSTLGEGTTFSIKIPAQL